MDTSKTDGRRVSQTAAGGLLVVAGLAWMLYFGPRFVGLELDLPWPVGFAFHGLVIVLVVSGLALVGPRLVERGWPLRLWYVGVGLAVTGLTIGHPMWSAAMLVLATVMVVVHRRWVPALLLTSGGSLWLYLFLSGLRIGDEDSRPIQGSEPATGLIAVALMGVGLIMIGRFARVTQRRRVGSGLTDQER